MRGRLVVAASFGSRIAAICSVATPRQAGHETPPQRGAVRREQPAVLVGERLGNTALVESSLVRRQPRKEIFDPRLEPAVFEKRDRGSPALAQIGGHQCRPTACSRRGGRIAVLTRAPAVIIGLSRERGEKPSEIEAETRCPLATRAQTNSGFALWRCLRWLAIAFALESVLLAWLPAEEVAPWLGAGSGLLAVPLAVTIGVITYINSFAAVPPVSGLIDRPWHEPGNGPRFYACRRGNERAR
jgi:hypothetical protein